MPAMTVESEILKYLPLLRNEDKKTVLSQIKSFLEPKEVPKRMSKEEFIIQYNKELDEAERRIEAGLYISQEDLEKEAETW
jgi:hypothetical protein